MWHAGRDMMRSWLRRLRLSRPTAQPGSQPTEEPGITGLPDSADVSAIPAEPGGPVRASEGAESQGEAPSEARAVDERKTLPGEDRASVVRLGLDFGTSTTLVAVRVDSRPPRVLRLEPGSNAMPSYIGRDADGS